LGERNLPLLFMKDEGDIVSPFVPEKDLRDEVNSRTAKAGYTTKYGEPTYRTKIQTVIPFGSQRLNIWPRDKNGNLLGD